MYFQTLIVILSFFLLFCSPRNLAGNFWPYCDEWAKDCSGSVRCINNHCVPWSCIDTANCADGFYCDNARCVSYAPLPLNGRYCDQYTPCSGNAQCYQNKCVASWCQYNTDCVEGFYCNGRSLCVGLNRTGATLGYCDMWTKCPSTHQCANKQCIPLSCRYDQDCI